MCLRNAQIQPKLLINRVYCTTATGAQKILEVIVYCGSVSIYLDALEGVVLFGSPAAFVQVFGTLGACVHVNRQAAVFLHSTGTVWVYAVRIRVSVSLVLIDANACK